MVEYLICFGSCFASFFIGYKWAKVKFYKAVPKRIRSLTELLAIRKYWVDLGNEYFQKYEHSYSTVHKDGLERCRLKVEALQDEIAEATAIQAVEDKLVKELEAYDKG